MDSLEEFNNSTLVQIIKALKQFLSIVCICLALLTITAKGQTTTNTSVNDLDSGLVSKEIISDTDDRGKVFTKMEIIAEFPGGWLKWHLFANKHFNFAYLQKQLPENVQRFEDSIIVKFVVSRDGLISDINYKAGNGVLLEPAIQLLKKSPKWEPGLNGSRQIHSYRTLQIDVLVDKQKNIQEVKRNYNSYYVDNR